jgi:hypothetical protein
MPALAPVAANAAVGDHWNPAPDQYREIRFEQKVTGWAPKTDWTAQCPSEFKYLDSRVQTEHRRLGKGIIGWEESFGVELTAEQRSYEILADGTKVFTGTTGYAYNAPVPFLQLAARVDMVCTDSLQHAWKDRPGSNG